jgi:excisionase family DNA binding protein
MLTRAKVRQRLGISKAEFLRLVRTGELTAIRTGDAPNSPYRISEESLADFIERRTVVPVRDAS